MAITASEARRSLFPLIQKVNVDRITVEITSKHGTAFLISAPEFESLTETAALLQVPENVTWLLESRAQADDGRAEVAGHDRPA